MANKKFTQLPTVPNATLDDIICAVQGASSVQETLSQIQELMLDNTIFSFAGDPNGNLAGATYQLCWDTVNDILFICTTTGTALTAVWTQSALNGIVDPTHGGTGVADPTIHTIPVAQGASDFNFLSLTNGQLLIGSTGLDPVPTTLTAGTNISVTNGAGTVTIASTGAASFSWSEVTGTSQAMAVNKGYVANNAGVVTLTLPVTSAFGDTLRVVGKGAGGWSIAQNGGQTIFFGTSTTTPGAGGSLSSTNRRDAISLVCTTANTEWTVCGGPEGNITVV
jgi:hypothetical protein